MKEKKHLIFDDYVLNKLLDKTEEVIGIEKLDSAKILIDTNDKLPDAINLENAVILVMCIIKDDNKFHPQQFLEEVLLET